MNLKLIQSTISYVYVCRVQIKFVISFPFSPANRGRICMCFWSEFTRTLITHGRTRLNKTLFLRTNDDQNRRREVHDQCSLWKERPQTVQESLSFQIWLLKIVFGQ